MTLNRDYQFKYNVKETGLKREAETQLEKLNPRSKNWNCYLVW